MRFTALLFLSVFVSLSCKKETGSGALEGKWKMIKYYDRNNNSFNTKPDTSKDVFLVFDGNKFTALSGLNPMYDGTYSLNGDDITFNTLNYYTDILTNDSWKDMFSWTIQACSLQSVYPCAPSTLEHLLTTQIRINTPLRMDIILMKVQ